MAVGREVSPLSGNTRVPRRVDNGEVRMRRVWIPAAILGVCAVGLAVADAMGADTVTVRTVTLNGKSEAILANAQGMTLYYFTKDTASSIACTGGCAKLWPPLLLTSAQPSGPASVVKGLTVFNGPDGRQVEYKGHPLYTYAGDKAPGDTSGNGLYHAWHVVPPTVAALSDPKAQTSQTANGGW